MERLLAFPGQGWIEAVERPYAALDGVFVKISCPPHIDPMGDAVGIGDDHGGPPIGLRLAHRPHQLGHVGTIGHLSNVDIAIGN